MCWGKEKTDGCMKKGTRGNLCWPFFWFFPPPGPLAVESEPTDKVQCSGDLGRRQEREAW